MALTQVNSSGIKDLEVKTDDIANEAVTFAKIENIDDGQILVGNGSNRPAERTLSGDVTMANTGAVTIANDAVEQAMIADDAVGLAQMAAGTDGQIITFDASGNPVAVGPGTDGQVLTSTGAGSPPAFEDVPAGGATINNATENEIVTVASNTGQLDAEANLTFTGSVLGLTGKMNIGTGMAAHDDANDFVISNDAAISGLSINNAADGYGCINFGDADDNDIGRIAYAHNGNSMRFHVNGAEKMRIKDGGNVTIEDGNLVVANGHGIDFAAQVDPYGTGNNKTTDSEVLSYYETGEFDPRMSAGGTYFDHTGAHGAQDGIYTRVGNMVTCYFRLGWTGINSASGTLRLDGFPFNGAQTPSGYYHTGTFADFWGFFDDGYNFIYGMTNNNYCNFHSTHHTGPASTSHIGGSNGGFSGTITYIAKD